MDFPLLFYVNTKMGESVLQGPGCASRNVCLLELKLLEHVFDLIARFRIDNAEMTG